MPLAEDDLKTTPGDATDPNGIDYAGCVGTHDIVLLTLDALRFDTAVAAREQGRTPVLDRLLPEWEPRHAPGSFTYASHAALFAGFWPTPVSPGSDAVRPFAVRGVASRSVGRRTARLRGQTIIEGLAARGYATACIGGVGFFDTATPLGAVFPSLFESSQWEPSFGPTSREASRRQCRAAAKVASTADRTRPLLLFMNLSATHQPTRIFADGPAEESVATQVDALADVDRHLPTLLDALAERSRPSLLMVMSDHGTSFGDDGYTGHRVGHPVVWTVPYAETVASPADLLAASQGRGGTVTTPNDPPAGIG